MKEESPVVSAVIPFSYESNEIRVIKDGDGNPWWVAKDVCNVLAIEWKGSGTLGPLDDDEKGVQKMDTLNNGGTQEMITISESGLYTLIIRSNKPEARKFRKWVTGEVLPQIRKTGSYQIATGPSLSPAQQRKIQTLISNKVYASGADGGRVGVLFRHIYRIIKDQYQVGCYKDIPENQLDELIDMIMNMVLPVQIEPVNQPKQIEADPETMKALLVQIKNEIVQELQPVVVPKDKKPGMTADEWNAAWTDLCDTHDMLSKAAEQFRRDVTDLLPERTVANIPKGADVLEHVRLYYSDMEKMARQINILVELLMWRSPKVMGLNMDLYRPRY